MSAIREKKKLFSRILELLQELQLSSGRGHLHVHVSSHWPREGIKLVKVALKTGDIVTQYAAQPHKWISDQYLWFQYSLHSIEGIDCGQHDQGIIITPGRGKRHFFCLKHPDHAPHSIHATGYFPWR